MWGGTPHPLHHASPAAEATLAEPPGVRQTSHPSPARTWFALGHIWTCSEHPAPWARLGSKTGPPPARPARPARGGGWEPPPPPCSGVVSGPSRPHRTAARPAGDPASQRTPTTAAGGPRPPQPGLRSPRPRTLWAVTVNKSVGAYPSDAPTPGGPGAERPHGPFAPARPAHGAGPPNVRPRTKAELPRRLT